MSLFFTSGGQSIGSFSFSISPSKEYFQLIFFRTDWFDLLAVQGTLKSLFQQQLEESIHLKASVLESISSSALSLLYGPHLHPYMTTGKTIALTRWTSVGKVTSLLLNMLSRLAIAFLPRSKHLLGFMAAVTICSDFGAPQNKVCHYFHYFPIYLPWSDGTGCHDLHFLNVKF